LQSLQRQVDGIAAKLDRLARESEPLHQHIADIEVHLCDIDDAQTAMAQRLATPALEAEPQP
jgi:septal ring factor EnvC (AmiA/AmiB activator)